MFPAVIGLLLSVLIPFLRGQPPLLARRLKWIIVAWISISVVAMVFLFVKRWQRVKRGGRLLYGPQQLSPWMNCFPAIFIIVFSSMLIALIFFAQRTIIIDFLGLESQLKQDARIPTDLTNWSWLFSILGAFAAVSYTHLTLPTTPYV